MKLIGRKKEFDELVKKCNPRKHILETPQMKNRHEVSTCISPSATMPIVSIRSCHIKKSGFPRGQYLSGHLVILWPLIGECQTSFAIVPNNPISGNEGFRSNSFLQEISKKHRMNLLSPCGFVGFFFRRTLSPFALIIIIIMAFKQVDHGRAEYPASSGRWLLGR